VRPLLAAALLLASSARAESEVVREEAFNYRVVGELPPSWKRDPERLAFTYSIEGVPHTHVHFVRERLRGELNVRDELKRRATHYRFPSAPRDAAETIEPVQWGGRDAFEYVHEAKINGLPCRRVVRATFDRGVWYECIETHHGEDTPAAQAGVACFRGGFRLLVEPVPKDERDDPAARPYRDGVYGFAIDKPQGWVRIGVNPAADPGARLAFERRGPKPDEHLIARVFEYGERKTYEPEKWLELFSSAFAREHAGAKTEPWPAAAIGGAAKTHGIRLTGRRDGKPVVALLALGQAPSGRVFAIRVNAHGGAEETHRESIAALLASFKLTDR